MTRKSLKLYRCMDHIIYNYGKAIQGRFNVVARLICPCVTLQICLGANRSRRVWRIWVHKPFTHVKSGQCIDWIYIWLLYVFFSFLQQFSALTLLVINNIHDYWILYTFCDLLYIIRFILKFNKKRDIGMTTTITANPSTHFDPFMWTYHTLHFDLMYFELWVTVLRSYTPCFLFFLGIPIFLNILKNVFVTCYPHFFKVHALLHKINLWQYYQGQVTIGMKQSGSAFSPPTESLGMRLYSYQWQVSCSYKVMMEHIFLSSYRLPVIRFPAAVWSSCLVI